MSKIQAAAIAIIFSSAAFLIVLPLWKSHQVCAAGMYEVPLGAKDRHCTERRVNGETH